MLIYFCYKECRYVVVCQFIPSVCVWVPIWSRLCRGSSQAISKPVWHIPLPFVQWKTPDDGQRNCPKHVEFHSKDKFEKLEHLVGFIIRKFPSTLFFQITDTEYIWRFKICVRIYNNCKTISVELHVHMLRAVTPSWNTRNVCVGDRIILINK